MNKKKVKHNEKMFKLEDFFCRDIIDFENKQYFPVNNLKGKSTKFKKAPNAFIDNEMRYYIRYLIVDKKYASTTIYNIVHRFVGTFYMFLIEKYEGITSILDFDIEKLEKEYFSWLERNGKQVKYYDTFILADMNTKKRVNTPSYILETKKFYDFIYGCVNEIDEKEKDRWELDKLGIPYNVNPSRREKSISFYSIKQKWLKEQAKILVYNQLPLISVNRIKQIITSYGKISKFIEDTDRDISTLKFFSRKDAEEFISYLTSNGESSKNIHGVTNTLKNVFDKGKLLQEDEYPSYNPFLDVYNVKRCSKFIEGYSKDEIKRLLEYINEAPTQIARITMVLVACGMRVCDLLSATIKIKNIDALRLDKSGGYVFSYLQPKTNEYNTIPVSDEVADTIKNAIKDSKEAFGEETKYIFADSRDTCIRGSYYLDQMNKLSYKYSIKADAGGGLRVRGHAFRRYVATNLINNGATPDIIKMVLGHESNTSYKHYAVIHSETMQNILSNIIARQEYMIQNIGNLDIAVTSEVEKGTAMPLLGGYCANVLFNGDCGDAYKCYTCKMFRPDKDYLDLYKTQLHRVEIAIKTSEINGHVRLVEKNNLLKKAIEAIIEQLVR